jgi:hypothetical protein
MNGPSPGYPAEIGYSRHTRCVVRRYGASYRPRVLRPGHLQFWMINPAHTKSGGPKERANAERAVGMLEWKRA